MKSIGQKFSLRALMLALAMFMALPLFAVSAQAQDGWWGNRNQDRNQNRRERRRDRRDDRRERRQDRREDRRDDRNRNDDYYDNDGYYGNNRNRNDGYYGNNGYGNDNARQTALNAGYNNGIEEGRKDRQRNERFDYRDESDYQKATEDYSSRLGDRARYQAYFRQGFANGYRAGYNGY